MADDTRVTHSRPGLACALALVCALGCVLPAAALAPDIIVRRDPGLSAAERADVRADAGREARAHAARCRTPSSSRCPTAREAARRSRRSTPTRTSATPRRDVKLAAATIRSRPVGARERRPAAAATAPATTPTSTCRRPGRSPRGRRQTVAVVDQQHRRAHPDLAANIAPGARTSSTPTQCRPTRRRPARSRHPRRGPDRRAAPTTASASPASRRWRTCCRCGRSTTAAAASSASIAAAFDYAGRRRTSRSSSAVVRDRPAADEPRATRDGDRPRHRRARSSSSPPATMATSTTPATTSTRDSDAGDRGSVPVQRPAGERRSASARRDTADDAPVCWGNVGGDVASTCSRPARGSTSTGASGSASRRRTRRSRRHVGGGAAGRRGGGAAGVSDPSNRRRRGRCKQRCCCDGVDPMPGSSAISASGGRLNAARAAATRPRGRWRRRPRRPWVSCDADHDGVRDVDDNCPDARRTPTRPTPTATASATPCDPTPRGDDADGDGKAVARRRAARRVRGDDAGRLPGAAVDAAADADADRRRADADRRRPRRRRPRRRRRRPAIVSLDVKVAARCARGARAGRRRRSRCG